MPRCPNGTRINHKTKRCEPHRKTIPTSVPKPVSSPKVASPTFLSLPMESLKNGVLLTDLLEKHISYPVLVLVSPGEPPFIQILSNDIPKKLEKIYKRFHSEKAKFHYLNKSCVEYQAEDANFLFYHVPPHFFQSWLKQHPDIHAF